MICIVIVIALVMIFGAYFYFSPKEIEGGVPFNVEGTDNVIVSWGVPLNEESVRTLAEKSINVTSFYIIDEVSKENEVWTVKFACHEDPGYVCGGRILIEESERKISIQHYR